MEVQKDLLEKQKMKNFSYKKLRWTLESESNCVKEWKLRKICLKNKRWGALIIRNHDGHLKTTIWKNGSSKRSTWEAENEKIWHSRALEKKNFRESETKVSGAKRIHDRHPQPPRIIMNRNKEEEGTHKYPWKVSMLYE